MYAGEAEREAAIPPPLEESAFQEPIQEEPKEEMTIVPTTKDEQPSQAERESVGNLNQSQTVSEKVPKAEAEGSQVQMKENVPSRLLKGDLESQEEDDYADDKPEEDKNED